MPRVSSSTWHRTHGGAVRMRGSTDLETRVGERIKPRADGCWIFDDDPDHYGRVRFGLRGAEEQAHRWVFRTLAKRIIPDGYHLHHLCENKGCVNPDHLQPMSPGAHRKLHHELLR